MKRAWLFLPIALAAALLVPLFTDAPARPPLVEEHETSQVATSDVPARPVGLEFEPAAPKPRQDEHGELQRKRAEFLAQLRRRAQARRYQPTVRQVSIPAWQAQTAKEAAAWDPKPAWDKAVLTVRNLRATARQRIQALATLESQTHVTKADADNAGLSVRQAHLRALYDRSGLTEGEVRDVVLAALVYDDARTRRRALARVKEHTFTSEELLTAVSALIRADERSAWYAAEQLLDRTTLARRTGEDLVSDWDHAFRDGASKRRRFLIGLGARLKPRPVGLASFLQSALRDAAREVRTAAVNALARLVLDGDANADVLAGAATDHDERVAQLATEWIETFERRR